MSAEPRLIPGCDLVVGDVVYTLGGRDTITGFRPYEGTLFPEGARIARFARARLEMTVPDDELVTVYVPEVQP